MRVGRSPRSLFFFATFTGRNSGSEYHLLHRCVSGGAQGSVAKGAALQIAFNHRDHALFLPSPLLRHIGIVAVSLLEPCAWKHHGKSHQLIVDSVLDAS